MAIFDPTREPVSISLVNKGGSFQVFHAMQQQNHVGAFRIDWTRTGAGIQTCVGYGHAGYLAYFERLITTVFSYTGRFVILTDFWDMPTYDSGFRTGETEVLTKHRSKHECSHLLVQTKVVAMGVSVSASAQGSVPHTNYKDRAEFEKVVAKYGLPTRRPVSAAASEEVPISGVPSSGTPISGVPISGVPISGGAPGVKSRPSR